MFSILRKFRSFGKFGNSVILTFSPAHIPPQEDDGGAGKRHGDHELEQAGQQMLQNRMPRIMASGGRLVL